MLARSSCQTLRSALQTRTINANQAGEQPARNHGCSGAAVSASQPAWYIFIQLL